MLAFPEVVARLTAAGCVVPGEEARDLLAACPDVDAAVARREAGEPLAWITGVVTFCGLFVSVEPGVYVPRSQSEAIARAATGGTRAIELCCGSGAISAVLLADGAEVIATDIDAVAVECARGNGVDARVGHLDEPIPASWAGAVDVVVAVVPYVPTESRLLLPADARDYEPAQCHDGGPDGLRWLREVAERAGRWLRAGGRLVLECGTEQITPLEGILRDAGFGTLAVIVDQDGDPCGVSVTWSGLN